MVVLRVLRDYIGKIVAKGDYKMVVLEESIERFVILEKERIIGMIEDTPPYSVPIFSAIDVEKLWGIFKNLYIEYCKIQGYSEEEIKEIEEKIKEAEVSPLKFIELM